MPQKSGTLIISVLSTISRWCRDMQQDVCFQIRFQSSVTAMIDQLGWVTLEQRRKRNRLIQLYKIINGYTLGTELPATYHPQTTTTRHYHPSRFILPAANTTNYQFSFFYRTTKDWNDLPSNFYDASTLTTFVILMHTHN